MTKPVVQYRPNEFTFINVGRRASVHGLDHPFLGEDWISTSIVQSHNVETGEFETENTVYVVETKQ